MNKQILLTGILAVVLGSWAACVFAQTAATSVTSATSATSEQPLEEVVVTGSRIASSELQSFAPVQVLSGQSIESVGTINVANVLRDMPSVGTSGLSTTNSNFLTNDAGINTVNLRNLGDSRTLVLVNGRRMTPGVETTSIADLNTIPTDFIDHIEIVTGGASAIYGSDAVAGAVNIILRKNLDGFDFHAQGGQSGDNDSGNYTLGMTFGTPVADGRGHLMFNATRTKDQGLRSAQRASTATDETVTPSGLHNPQFSSYNPQGNFLIYSAQSGLFDLFSFDKSGGLVDGNFGPGYNRSAQRIISVPTDRTLLSTLFDYEVTEHHKAYTEFTYADTTTRSQIEPIPLASNGTNSVYGTAGDPFGVGDFIGVPITNAYLQTLPVLAPVVSEINTWNSTGANCTGTAATNPRYDCITSIQFRRRLSDLGDRANDATRQTMRIVLGMKGDLPFGDWKYDASFVYGRTTAAQTGLNGGVNLLSFQQALNSVVDPTTGKIVCANALAANQGCVPVNIFGVNSISAAAAAYLRAPITFNTSVAEQVANAYVTGYLGELPAGKVNVVVGAEARQDKSSVVWDPLTNEGLNSQNALPNVAGSINVKEAFAEFEVPLLKDVLLAKSLSFDGAIRHADYSTSGAVDAWKVGLNWAPAQSLRLRAVYSVAVRAPNIGELYGGQSQTFPSVTDPCDGITNASSGQVATACRAVPAIATALAKNGVFAYSPLDYQQISGLVGSNPNLQAEKSKTKTFGFVVTPSGLPNFAMTVDYFDIVVRGAVSSINFDTSIRDCLTSGEFCGNVIRSSVTGKITNLLQLNLNVGYIRSSGIDTTMRYGWDLGGTRAGGRLDLSLTETHQLKLEQAVPGAPTEVDLGQLNSPTGGRLGAGFRDRATLNLNYNNGFIEANWKLNYQSAIVDSTPANGIVYAPLNNVPAYIYNDAQIKFNWGTQPKLSTYIGANNVFNKKPPFLPQGMASDVTGTNTAADSYDVIGVFLYAGLNVRF